MFLRQTLTRGFAWLGFGVCFAISVLRVRLPVRGESDLQNVEAGGHWGAELRGEESGACFVIGFNTDTLRLATRTDSSSSSPLRCRVPLQALKIHGGLD